MIGYLKGEIKYIGLNWIILDVNGVGYKVYINSKFEARNSKQISNSNVQNSKLIGNRKLPARQGFAAGMAGGEIGNSLEAYIYHHLREDVSDLYGFQKIEELQIFELLLEVPGVGPKMAMKILSKTGVDKLKEAISKGDSALLTAISGIGKKMAMKILVELKHKISSDVFASLDASEASLELIEAMEALGYKKGEIGSILAKMPEDLTTTQEKIKWVLQHVHE